VGLGVDVDVGVGVGGEVRRCDVRVRVRVVCVCVGWVAVGGGALVGVMCDTYVCTHMRNTQTDVC
jgi:1,4-dihydroxy-2-naphthoyl-CoA synthase